MEEERRMDYISLLDQDIEHGIPLDIYNTLQWVSLRKGTNGNYSIVFNTILTIIGRLPGKLLLLNQRRVI